MPTLLSKYFINCIIRGCHQEIPSLSKFISVKYLCFKALVSQVIKNFFFKRLKADKELVKDVYSAAKKLKMDRVKQVEYQKLTYIRRTITSKSVFTWLECIICHKPFFSFKNLKMSPSPRELNVILTIY